MNKYLLTFSGLFLSLSALVFPAFRKYLALGINHSIYYCQTLFGFVSPHVSKEFNLIIVSGGLLLLAIVFLRIIRTFFHLKALQKELTDEIYPPNKLENLISELNLANKVKLINSKKPFAFCFGLYRQKIYISSTLLEAMSHTEIKAILLHERWHLRSRDSLTLFIGRITENLFPFFPIVSDLVRNFRIKREINADSAAAISLGSGDAVISALRKLLIFETRLATIYPNFADADTLESRFLALANRNNPERLNLAGIFFSLFFLLVFLSIIVTPISASEIHRGQTDIMLVCLNSKIGY